MGLANCVNSDWELVARAREGCQDAFGELVQRHYQSCVEIASFVLRDRAEALDEVQKAWCNAYTRLDQYRGEAEFSSWILRIVVNQCRMLLRIRKRANFLYIDANKGRERTQFTELLAPGAGPEEQVIGGEVRDMLQREIRRIPPVFRNVLFLRDVMELPMRNVAEQLNISVPAAKSRLLRARLELKMRVLRQLGGDKHNRPPLKLRAGRQSSGIRRVQPT